MLFQAKLSRWLTNINYASDCLPYLNIKAKSATKSDMNCPINVFFLCSNRIIKSAEIATHMCNPEHASQDTDWFTASGVRSSGCHWNNAFLVLLFRRRNIFHHIETLPFIGVLGISLWPKFLLVQLWVQSLVLFALSAICVLSIFTHTVKIIFWKKFNEKVSLGKK